MNRSIARVALAAAAALTVSLASPVAAQAQESGTAGVAPAAVGTAATSTLRTAGVQAAEAAAPVIVKSFRLVRGYSWDHRITRDAEVSTRVGIDFDYVEGYIVREFTADLYINNRAIGPVTISRYASSVSWHKRFGYGTAQLRNLRASVYPPRSSTAQVVPIGTASNSFRIRRDFDRNLQMKYSKRGKKMTVRAYKWRVNQPNGKYASVKKVKLQRLKGGKWRNFKTIKVNKSGNGKISFSSKKKYKYRLVYSTTTTIQGARTYASAKV